MHLTAIAVVVYHNNGSIGLSLTHLSTHSLTQNVATDNFTFATAHSSEDIKVSVVTTERDI